MKTDFLHVSKLIGSNGISEMTANITAMTCELFGFSRSCLVLKEGKTFIIKAGFQESQHGIGQKVPQDGRKLFQQVLDEKNIVMTGHPDNDPRTRYIHELVKAHKIKAIMFVPLFHNNVDIGILIIDAINSESTLLFLRIKEIEEFASFCSILLWKELDKERIYKDIRQKAAMSALDEQAASIAHAFKNPLTPIIGSAECILEKPDNQNRVKEKADRILKESIRLNNLVQRILNFSKSATLSLEKCNINDLIKGMVVAANLKEKNIYFCFNFDKHLNDTPVFIDCVLLENSLHYIANNAIEAGARKIVFKTISHPDKNIFRIMIGNDGEPIKKTVAPNDQQCIFSPYFTTKKEGTGIGLSDVKKVILAHDGEITVRSEEPQCDKNHSKGHRICTWFDISLPLKR